MRRQGLFEEGGLTLAPSGCLVGVIPPQSGSGDGGSASKESIGLIFTN